jgi:hypothetical protein
MADPPKAGKIEIEWFEGTDPSDFETYTWKLTCYPALDHDRMTGLLAEIVRVS